MATRIGTGARLPDIELMTMADGEPRPVSTTAFFAGRRIALFAVPGAWTPTCSARHLPGFIYARPALLAAGVDAVACTAVNDVFVLDAWLAANGGAGIVPLADGNGSFARAIGLEFDASAFGMGVRSQRYALLARDGFVDYLAVDEPGEYRVSSAERMLATLAPDLVRG